MQFVSRYNINGNYVPRNETRFRFTSDCSLEPRPRGRKFIFNSIHRKINLYGGETFVAPSTVESEQLSNAICSTPLRLFYTEIWMERRIAKAARNNVRRRSLEPSYRRRKKGEVLNERGVNAPRCKRALRTFEEVAPFELSYPGDKSTYENVKRPSIFSASRVFILVACALVTTRVHRTITTRDARDESSCGKSRGTE